MSPLSHQTRDCLKISASTPARSWSQSGRQPLRLITTTQKPKLLYVEVVNFLAAMPQVRMVMLPRNEKTQRDFVYRTWPALCDERRIIVPERVVDGLNLIWHSDLVVSGGGTMNREAAALGVPVYSIFRGKMGAVDRYLSQKGRLTLIETPADVRVKIQPVKRPKGTSQAIHNDGALREILAAANELWPAPPIRTSLLRAKAAPDLRRSSSGHVVARRLHRDPHRRIEERRDNRRPTAS